MLNAFRTGLRKVALLAALAVMAGWIGAGCGDSGDGGGSDNSAFVGTWLVTKHDDTPSSSVYVFSADGTFRKMRVGEPANGAVHMTGTYTVDGETLKGNFTNPGIGSGEIVATIDNGTLNMDFIEHWQSPYKHIPCTGVKQ